MGITKSCRDIKQLNPLAQTACNLFLAECKRAGINIFITETYRSQARQNYLYEQGRTRPGQVVTWTKNSNHTGRMAWDIAASPPKQLYDVATLNAAGAVAKRLGITWGGSWSTPDRPHFEISNTWKVPTQNAGTIKQEDEVVKQIQIKVNGKVKTVQVVEVGGNNHVKLQDLRDDKIAIGYENKMPTVTVR